MAKNSLTLQINSLEALEKLIGGDTQVEIDIRNNIVQAFAEKHLKSLAGSNEIQTVLSAIKASIQEDARKECQRLFGMYQSSWKHNTVILNEDLKALLKEEVQKEISSFMESYISELVAKPESLRDKLERYVKVLTNNIISAELESKIPTSVQKAIDEQVSKLKLTFNVSKGE